MYEVLIDFTSVSLEYLATSFGTIYARFQQFTFGVNIKVKGATAMVLNVEHYFTPR